MMAMRLWRGRCRGSDHVASRARLGAAAGEAGARGIGRRKLGVSLAALVGSSMVGRERLKAEPLPEAAGEEDPLEGRYVLFAQASGAVLPKEGFQSRIALKDSVLGLVRHEVIDPQKLSSIYADRGGLPPSIRYRLKWPSTTPIRLTRESANDYVDLLWPLGLANWMSTNETSPINGEALFNFASTGGWWLGKELNGGAYFNKFRIVELTPEQEVLATRVAETTYRPCCNNSTFYQDCNHGSALLGLLELGASQGLSEDELYREALAFNSFWFPDVYVGTALYFKVFEGVDWQNVDPRVVMGYEYSAVGPWQQNVSARIETVPDLIPEQRGGADCGL